MSGYELLGSAPTLAEISTVVTRFFYGAKKQIVPNGADAWRIVDPRDGRVIESARVVKKRGRYRFEMEI